MFEPLSKINHRPCACQKEHSFDAEVIIGEGAISSLLQIFERLGAKSAFLIADKNTDLAAGKLVSSVLDRAGVKTFKYVFSDKELEPDEKSVGRAVMNFPPESDVVLGIGGGVINDIGKIVAAISRKPYIIVATAPSMDGYASATSSMTLEGIKISLQSKCPEFIIGDLDILCKAPQKLMISGLGDMLAKYISICEWRISNLINGEYFCPAIADLIRNALKKCTDNAKGLLKRDKTAVRAVFEGLIICGAAMKFAGISRPASGVEHYISHIFDMRKAEFGTAAELHGIQCALGTYIAAGLYEKLKALDFDREKALAFAKSFDYNKYKEFLRGFLGKSAEGMIALEEKEKKYDIFLHQKRLEKILENRDKIIKIIDEEIPPQKELSALFDLVKLPKSPEEIGIESALIAPAFKATKDIRDKYVLSRLCHDLGIINEII